MFLLQKVYAVECSGISHLCEKLIEKNGFSEVITVLRGKVEDVTLDEKVDIIISEWMGLYLFHESMLFSVFAARDKFLKPDGLVLPTGAHLFACPTSVDTLYKETAGFWKNIYDFDFSPATEVAMLQKSFEPQIISLQEKDLLSEPRFVTAVETMYAEEGEFDVIKVEMKFKVSKYGVIRGLALWFDVFFDVDGEGSEESVDENIRRFSTGPSFPETHWRQTVIMLPEAILVSPGAMFTCHLILTRNESDRRKYLLTLGIPDETQESDEEEEEEEGDMENGDNPDFEISVVDMIREKIN